MGRPYLLSFFGVTLLVALSSCASSKVPTKHLPASASLGDTWVRPADEMVMLYIPNGEFQMGSSDEELDYAVQQWGTVRTKDSIRAQFEDEQPVHTVALDSFWIDQTEVTNGQYRQCEKARACSSPGTLIYRGSYTRNPYYGDSDHDNFPVLDVNWSQAAKYCEWAGARLPTEAEWEYAARGPEGAVFPWGNEFDGTLLNYCDVGCSFDWAHTAFDDGYNDTAPVGSYPHGASWCGVLDLAGNVQEWVADWYGDYPSSQQVNPLGPSSGDTRVQRGGTWSTTPIYTRNARRNRGDPGSKHWTAGFRCAMDSE